MNAILKNLIHFITAETVLFISGTAAIITMFFVKPSINYIDYVDFRVLVLLFCLMAVVSGFNKTGVFLQLSEKLLKKVVGIRSLSFVLIMLCFFSSMWITNDVALITFVPFAVMVLNIAGQSKYTLRIVVLQTIAANLGSMLTPVGNPQNLYLYSFYNIPILHFLKITLPFTVVSFLLLIVTILMIKKEPLEIDMPDLSQTIKKSFACETLAPPRSRLRLISDLAACASIAERFLFHRNYEEISYEIKKQSYTVGMYSALFLLCLSCVLHLLDYRLVFVIVFVIILLFDKKVLKKVDYALLLTFVCFFIFVGNMGQIPAVKEFLAGLLSNRELGVSIAASQIISNVPAAVLLSGFTKNYRDLILGTDIGGLGTLVASLASLISYKIYCRTRDARPGRYLGIFTVYNVVFLAVLCLFYII